MLERLEHADLGNVVTWLFSGADERLRCCVIHDIVSHGGRSNAERNSL